MQSMHKSEAAIWMQFNQISANVARKKSMESQPNACKRLTKSLPGNEGGPILACDGRIKLYDPEHSRIREHMA